MNDAVVTLLAALGGALIGGGASYAAQSKADRHQRKEDRRRERIELVSHFWEAVQLLRDEVLGYELAAQRHRSARKTADIVQVSIVLQHEAGDTASAVAAAAASLEDYRQKVTAARQRTNFLLAQMRLLYPTIADDALRLRDAATNYDPERRAESREAHKVAQDAFEAAARRLLGEPKP